MDFEKKSNFPSKNATNYIKIQSNHSSICFCVDWLIHKRQKKKTAAKKDAELSLNYQGMAWSVHHY